MTRFQTHRATAHSQMDGAPSGVFTSIALMLAGFLSLASFAAI